MRKKLTYGVSLDTLEELYNDILKGNDLIWKTPLFANLPLLTITWQNMTVPDAHVLDSF